jgi:hypothetical protein
MAKPLSIGIVAGVLVLFVTVFWTAALGTSADAASYDKQHVLSDVRVGYSLWWAERGEGQRTTPGEEPPYRTVIIRERSIILIREDGGGLLLPINDALQSFYWTKQ